MVGGTVRSRPAVVAGRVGFRIHGLLARFLYIAAIELAAVIILFDPKQHREALSSMTVGTDVHNYWQAWQGGLYHGSRLVYGAGVYLYSPAFAQLFYPLTVLDFTLVRILWAIPAVIGFWWLVRPAAVPYRIGLFAIGLASVATGNIEWLICVAVVLGMRYPGMWAIVLLTKVTPGLGLLWFAARNEWRALWIALGWTVAVVAVSFVLVPSLWFDWLDLLVRNATAVHPRYEGLIGLLPLRLIAAAAIIWIGARRNRPEALVLGLFLATPDINVTTFAMACVLPRLALADPVDADRSRGDVS